MNPGQLVAKKYKTKRCKMCGKEFSPYAANQQYCSFKCRHKADTISRKMKEVGNDEM